MLSEKKNCPKQDNEMENCWENNLNDKYLGWTAHGGRKHNPVRFSTSTSRNKWSLNPEKEKTSVLQRLVSTPGGIKILLVFESFKLSRPFEKSQQTCTLKQRTQIKIKTSTLKFKFQIQRKNSKGKKNIQTEKNWQMKLKGGVVLKSRLDQWFCGYCKFGIAKSVEGNVLADQWPPGSWSHELCGYRNAKTHTQPLAREHTGDVPLGGGVRGTNVRSTLLPSAVNVYKAARSGIFVSDSLRGCSEISSSYYSPWRLSGRKSLAWDSAPIMSLWLTSIWKG